MNRKLVWVGWMVAFGWWLLSGPSATAQAQVDAQRRYKAAVRLVQTGGDYERAKFELNTLIQREDALAPYAHYYYALAAFRQKNYNQARPMLRQLMARYPDWRKMDDAQYLLAAVCFETGQYEDGFSALQRISDPTLRPDVTKMEQAFLPRITDLNLLKRLNRQHPDNRNIGLALIDLIQRTGTDKDDLELSDRLTNRFGLPTPVRTTASSTPVSTSAARPTTGSGLTTPVPNRTNRAKGYYNVAVLFPFRVDDFEAGKRGRTNQYVYDLYNGIKMAKTRLQEEGITVNLFAYDVDNDANRTLELVNSPAFAQTDLMIGPLYVEPNRIATAFANQNGIALINPIATSSDLVANQPMAFLAQPSVQRQAQKVAEQARALNGSRRAAIYFGTARKDSLLAQAYQTELKRQNYQIVDFRKLSGNAQAMADAMFTTSPTARPGASTVASTSATVRPTPTPVPGSTLSLGHVFFASSNDDDGARLLDALSRRRVSGPVIATASAFDYYRNSLSTFTRRELYLLYPEFVDNSRQPVTDFQEEYLSKRNIIPSVFACQGYDMMLFFGRQLAKNGLSSTNRSSLRSDTDDYLLSGFDYSQSNENQIVPIVKYEEGRFVKIN